MSLAIPAEGEKASSPKRPLRLTLFAWFSILGGIADLPIAWAAYRTATLETQGRLAFALEHAQSAHAHLAMGVLNSILGIVIGYGILGKLEWVRRLFLYTAAGSILYTLFDLQSPNAFHMIIVASIAFCFALLLALLHSRKSDEYLMPVQLSAADLRRSRRPATYFAVGAALVMVATCLLPAEREHKEVPASNSTEAQSTAADRPGATEDWAITQSLQSFAEKAPAYKLLLEMDPTFKQEFVAAIKTHPGSADADAALPRAMTDLMQKYMDRYLPFADDVTVAQAMYVKSDICVNSRAYCEAIFGGTFASLPADVVAKMRNSESSAIASGLLNYNAGARSHASFTAGELARYLAKLERLYPEVRDSGLAKMYDKPPTTAAACAGLASLSSLKQRESTADAAKLWRTFLTGPKS